MKIRIKKFNQNNKFKSVKFEVVGQNKLYYKLIKNLTRKSFLLLLIILFPTIISIIIIFSRKIFQNITNFDYENYEKNIITEEIIQTASWNITNQEAFLINGIIRKHKPKKCLEIGVGKGSISLLILNAIKDTKNSLLVSIDLHRHVQDDDSKHVGYKVEKYFSEKVKNWKLLTGDMPFRFLEKLNLKFDFAIIDTTNKMPGEVLNIIEIMPFLEDNAIIIFPNILSHLKYDIVNVNKTFPISTNKTIPTSMLLMSSLVGKKIIYYNKNKMMGNVGVIFLKKSQKKYYENYFLLLMCLWEDMLTDELIFKYRLFIEKYYKEQKLINIFENAVFHNKEYQKNIKL